MSMLEDAQLFIGLGNPGSKYENNRHNFGFMAIEAIARALNATAFAEKFGGEFSRVGDLYLFKPMGFMNNSGIAAAKIASFYKIPPEKIFVFYDELDLELGKLKIKQGGGDGGHNGIKSLDSHMGKNYWRVRMGIGHPGHRDMVHGHVLGDFAPDEQPTAEKCIKGIAENISHLIKGDQNLFLTRYAGSPPPRAAKPSAKPPEEKSVEKSEEKRKAE